MTSIAPIKKDPQIYQLKAFSFSIIERISKIALTVIQAIQYVVNAAVAGLRGLVVVAALELDCLKVYKAIISHGPISDWSRAKAVIWASKHNSLGMLKVLLSNGSISKTNLEKAICTVFRNPQLNLKVAEEIINAFATGELINEKDRKELILNIKKKIPFDKKLPAVSDREKIINMLFEKGLITKIEQLKFILDECKETRLFLNQKIASTRQKSLERMDSPVSKTTYVTPLLPLNDVSSYDALWEKTFNESEPSLYITDETGQRLETLKFLGGGGSKKAWEISGGRALLLPSFSDSTATIARIWERIVLEEVAMSKVLTKLGLLSPLSKQVSVKLTEFSESIIPAYISESFESLSLKGCFVIDQKNSKSSTWKSGEHFLFQSDEERLNEKNWDSIFDSVLTDIAKICLYNIPSNIDSLNIAIVKKPSDSAVAQHEVRYFGFDFSSKDGLLSIPDADTPSTSPDISQAKKILNSIITNVVWCEFFESDSYYEKKGMNIRKLIERLVEKYVGDIEKRMSCCKL